VVEFRDQVANIDHSMSREPFDLSFSGRGTRGNRTRSGGRLAADHIDPASRRWRDPTEADGEAGGRLAVVTADPASSAWREPTEADGEAGGRLAVVTADPASSAWRDPTEADGEAGAFGRG
jgi:hypothetical protein